MRLVQGSHIVVPKLFDHDCAYIFQRPDGRIFFAIPYERDFTLIGTTDRDTRATRPRSRPRAEEIAYLCEAAGAAFPERAARRRGVDLFRRASALRRRRRRGQGGVARLRAGAGRRGRAPPPLLSIIGGKITTYRRLAEAALERLARAPARAPGLAAGWTGTTPLPGGDFARRSCPRSRSAWRALPFLEAAHAARLVHAYGARAARVLGEAKSAADLGRHFGAT